MGAPEKSKTDIGYELPSLCKVVTLDKMRKFSAWHGKTIHVDEELALQVGLPGPIAEGLMSYAYLMEVMLSFFGESWLRGGVLSVNFLGYVLPGDTITARAVVMSRETEESRDRIGLQVWCENQRGEKVVAGTANGFLPKSA